MALLLWRGRSIGVAFVLPLAAHHHVVPISELFILSPVPCIHSVTSEHFLVLGWDILHYSTLSFHGLVLAGFHRDLDSFVPVRNICFFNLACLLAYRHIAVCLHSVAFFRLVSVDVISIMCFAADIVICPCCLT